MTPWRRRGGVSATLGLMAVGVVLVLVEVGQWVTSADGEALLIGVSSSSPAEIEVGGCVDERLRSIRFGDERSPSWRVDGDARTGQTVRFGVVPDGMTVTDGPGVLPASSERVSIAVTTDRRTVSTALWGPVFGRGVFSEQVRFDDPAAFRAAARSSVDCSDDPWWHAAPPWLGPTVIGIGLAVFAISRARRENADLEGEPSAGLP